MINYSNTPNGYDNNHNSRVNSNDPTMRAHGSQRINENRVENPPIEIFGQSNQSSEPRYQKMKNEYANGLKDRYNYDNQMPND
jgi:hypothetical protein